MVSSGRPNDYIQTDFDQITDYKIYIGAIFGLHGLVIKLGLRFF